LSNAFFLPPAELTTSNTLKRIVFDRGLKKGKHEYNVTEFSNMTEFKSKSLNQW